MNKDIYTVYTKNPAVDPSKFFIMASWIRWAHLWGRACFGPGISFSTREPNTEEKLEIAGGALIHEAEEEP
jgi:hypothetical protein